MNAFDLGFHPETHRTKFKMQLHWVDSDDTIGFVALAKEQLALITENGFHGFPWVKGFKICDFGFTIREATPQNESTEQFGVRKSRMRMAAGAGLDSKSAWPNKPSRCHADLDHRPEIKGRASRQCGPSELRWGHSLCASCRKAGEHWQQPL
jgi:hypothetical protein